MQLRPQKAHSPGSRQSCWRRASECHTSPAHSSCCWSPPLQEKTGQKERIKNRSGLGLRKPGTWSVPGWCLIIRLLTLAPGQSQAGSQLSQEKLLMTFTFTTAAGGEKLLFPFKARRQTQTIYTLCYLLQHLDLKLTWEKLRKTDADFLFLNLPVKSTFPYRSWICGARPSLKRYKLCMTTYTKQIK